MGRAKPTAGPVAGLSSVYRIRNPWGGAGAWLLVVGPTFCGVRTVGLNRGYYDGVTDGVVSYVIHEDRLKNYPPLENSACQDDISTIKVLMLTHGASALAVEWVSQIASFTNEELNTMAAKLKTKGEAEAEAAPAKVAKGPKPVGAAAKKGNAEGLEKARAAAAGKREELRGKKITALVKLADVKGREGTFRRDMLGDLLKSKTVGAFMELNEKYDAGCVRFAEGEGYISLT